MKIISEACIDEAYEDVEAIWESHLAAAGIEEHESWSGGSQGFALIDFLPPENEQK